MHKSVEQFKVETLEVAGLGSALSALRLPFGKECRSDFSFNFNEATSGDGDVRLFFDSVIDIDERDIKLMSTLAKNGDEHAKVLRGINVWAEISAPLYWWNEAVTYRIGSECLASTSTMHIECRGMAEYELVETKENMPMGHIQKRVLMLSYQTLRRIYKQRHNHRLPQWHLFCDWIKTLPYSLELILVGLE